MKTTKLILFFAFLFSTPAFSQCWRSVSVGFANIFAIAENGTLWAWGKNSNGELGDGTNIKKNVPVQIGTANNWREIAASIDGIYSFTLGVRTDGTLWAWGSNNSGQLGDGTYIPRSIPVQIGTDTDWKTVATGLSHSLAIKENGTLWGWGVSYRYSLSVPSGLDVLSPRQIGTDSNWRQVSAHDCVSVAVKTDNTVWAWGWNKNNFLDMPFGTVIANDIYYPTQKNGGINVRKTATGDRRSMDITTGNYIDGSGNPPRYVFDADNGYRTTAFIRLSDRTLWYAGLTLGGTSSVGNTQLGTATNWSSINVGSQNAAAINTNKELFVWGTNFYGSLGNGTDGSGMTAYEPVLVPCPSALLGTSDNELKLGLQLYPNPARDVIIIESDALIDYLVVTDVRGKEISKQSYNNTTITYDVSLLSSGMYFVKAYSGALQNQIKFIKN